MAKLFSLLIGLVFVLTGPHAWAGGYEKVSLWSAKWAALGGASSGAVMGAESLAFNPAGLVNGASNEFSLNLSPTFSQFKGPNVPSQVQGETVAQQTAERGFSPIASLLYRRSINDKISVGAGLYSVGGANVEYKDVDFRSVDDDIDLDGQTIQSELKINEFSLGGAYRYSRNWSFGATWRIVMASGQMHNAQITIDNDEDDDIRSLLGVSLEDLKATEMGGIRLGAQYANDAKTFGAGLSVRNGIDFELEGKSSGVIDPARFGPQGPVIELPGGDITVASTLPTQVALGFFWQRTPGRTFFQETTFTQYSVNEKLIYGGAGKTLGPVSLQDTVLNWEDQWSLKFGYEYMETRGLTWRAGYSYATNVTPEDTARATSTAPGEGHTLAVGAGGELPWGGGKYTADVGIEYAMASGNGNTNGGSSIRDFAGKFESTAYTVHGSVKYRF